MMTVIALLHVTLPGFFTQPPVQPPPYVLRDFHCRARDCGGYGKR